MISRCCFKSSAIALAMAVGIVHADTSTLQFTNIATQNGMNLPSLLSESLAWGDYDNDGDEDLFVSSVGQNSLFQNNGNSNFVDVTAEAGLGNTGNFSVGSAFGDLDNDGDLDLIVINFDDDVLDELYRNDGPIGPNGAYVFTEIAGVAGITDNSLSNSSRGVVLIDYDKDTLLDIYVAAISGPDIFYRNLGNLQFESIALDIGLTNSNGESVGVVVTDVNNDNWPDLFIGNRSGEQNALYLNNQDGSFTDIGEATGIDKVGLGMGVLSFDFDNDGDLDLFWSTFPGDELTADALYENLYQDTGVVNFVDLADTAGTQDVGGWGVSCNAADIDNDGYEDFFVTNGANSSSTPSILYRNNGDKTFANVTDVIGGALIDGRGVAFADWDSDGDMDFFFTGGPNDDSQMWRNDSPNDNNWVTFKLEGTQSNRSSIGARITVTTELSSHTKMVSGGAGRGSFNSLPVEFGLGQAEQIVSVEVLWPNGLVQNLESVGLNQVNMVKELSVLMEGNCNGSLPTFNVTGATPNSRVSLYLGLLRQPSDLRFGNCAGTTLDLSNIQTQGRATTNSLGEATIHIRQSSSNICASLRRSKGVQVVSEATCTTSNIVTKAIQ